MHLRQAPEEKDGIPSDKRSRRPMRRVEVTGLRLASQVILLRLGGELRQMLLASRLQQIPEVLIFCTQITPSGNSPLGTQFLPTLAS